MVILLLPVASAPAQQGAPGAPAGATFVHQSWTVEDGLPVNHVNHLYQTPDGYLWMATFDGLVRFDGVRFRTFNAENTPGLPSNRLVTIQPGQGGSFWLTTEQNHLIRFDRKGIRSFVSNRNFHRARVMVDADSVTWIASRNGLFREVDGELIPHALDTVGRSAVRHVLRASSGDLWIATAAGIWRLGRDPPARYHVDAAGPAGVHRLYEDGRGVVWAAGAGIARFADGRFKTVVPREAPWVGDDPPFVFAMKDDVSGRLLISSARGLFRLRDGQIRSLGPVSEWQARPAAIQQDGAFSECPDGSIWAVEGGRLYRDGVLIADTGLDTGTLLCDREGNLWVATSSAGLHRFRGTSIRTVAGTGGSPPLNLYGVYEDRRGSIWFGSPVMVGRLSADGRVDVLSGSHFDGATAAFLDAADGSLWAGRHVCPAENRMPDGGCTRFDLDANLPAGVHAIAQTRDGSLWFGTNVGLIRRRNDSWTHFTTREGLPHGFVRHLLEARDGTLWMATNGGGIAQYDEMRAGEAAIRVISVAEGLPSNNVRGLHEDEEGFIWAATEDRGLARVDPASGEVATIGHADGLYDYGVHAILEDDEGRLWMSTNRGIFWIRRAELNAFISGHRSRVRSTFYTERDGMLNREANGGFQNAALRAADGRLWFATQNGAVMIDPRHTGSSLPLAPVVIEELTTAKGRVVDPVTGLVQLSARERSFVVRYSSPSFYAPERVRFRYRLDGFDDDWVEAENRREAIYTNVPPGSYTLLVTAAGGDGAWNGTSLPLTLSVAPYFYETWWFALFAVLLLLAALGGVYEYRILEIRRREAHLRTVVDDRTRELRLANARMEEQAAQLRVLDRAKSRFFADISHEFRTPLTMTIGPIRDVRDGRFGAMHSAAQDQLDVALRNARRLHRLTNQLLDLARLEAGHFIVQRTPGDLSVYLRTLARPFVATAERAGVALRIDVPAARIVVLFDPDHLDKVFANLLSNALKFTPPGGDVALVLRADTDKAVVTVRDTGTGIAPDHLPHVFDRFFQGQKSEMQPGTGIGLSLAKQIAELHDATIDVESVEDAGSTFTVTLPLIEEEESLDAAPPLASASTIASMAGDGESNPVDVNADEEEERPDATTVLVVDDNADIRSYVRHHLAATYRIVEAPDGVEALREIRYNLPDLVVSDVMMPRMDGFALLEALRSDRETDFLPVILLTARAEAQDRLAGLGLGADDYITKPFDVRELEARVDNLIAQRRRLKDRYAAEAERSRPAVTIHAESSGAVSADDALLERIRQTVEARMSDENFGVEELAIAIGMSRSSLHRRLTEATGESPSNLLRRMRLERGADLLRRRTGTVSEIAYAVGFKSVAHFSNSFRTHYQQTPSAFAAASSSAGAPRE